MSDLTLPEIAALDPRAYTVEMKSRLGDDHGWMAMIDPSLVERTREHLTRMIASIDSQKERVAREGGDKRWMHGINVLRTLAAARLNSLPPATGSSASSKEARAWRAFSAELAAELASIDPVALNRIKAPYGGLTALQWLSARGAKK